MKAKPPTHASRIRTAAGALSPLSASAPPVEAGLSGIVPPESMVAVSDGSPAPGSEEARIAEWKRTQDPGWQHGTWIAVLPDKILGPFSTDTEASKAAYDSNPKADAFPKDIGHEGRPYQRRESPIRGDGEERGL